MTTPYRTNALVVTRSPLWLRALAALVPDDIGAEFAWYRRVSGGRWSRAPELPVARIVGWRRVSECPANWHVFTPDELNAMPPLFALDAWSQSREAEEHRERCTCEVWP